MEDRLQIMLRTAGLSLCLMAGSALAEDPWIDAFRCSEAPWITLEWSSLGDRDVPRIRLVKQEVQPLQPPTAPALELPAPLPSPASEFSTSLFASSESARSQLSPVRKERLRAGSDVINPHYSCIGQWPVFSGALWMEAGGESGRSESARRFPLPKRCSAVMSGSGQRDE